MNSIQNNLCVIPARGGSKRIPRKNIRDFLGKPIVSYSIRAALDSKLFSDVIVSTDDVEISKIAIDYGASVPFLRSEQNSNDFASTISVLNEVVEKLNQEGKIYENICCVYPTAPFVNAEKLVESFHLLNERNFDSVLPVMPYNFPIQRSFVIDDERIQYQFNQYRNSRSQDLKESYHDAGQFYWMKRSVIGSDSIITNNSGAIFITQLEGQDIDNEIDWKLAELKYELLQSIK